MSKSYAYQSQELELRTAPAQPTPARLAFSEALPTRVPSEKITGPLAHGKSADRSQPEVRRYFAYLDDPTPMTARLEKDADPAQQLHSRIQQRKGGH